MAVSGTPYPASGKEEVSGIEDGERLKSVLLLLLGVQKADPGVTGSLPMLMMSAGIVGGGASVATPPKLKLAEVRTKV